LTTIKAKILVEVGLTNNSGTVQVQECRQGFITNNLSLRIKQIGWAYYKYRILHPTFKMSAKNEDIFDVRDSFRTSDDVTKWKTLKDRMKQPT
jgi:hypothetical protein